MPNKNFFHVVSSIEKEFEAGRDMIRQEVGTGMTAV